VYEAHTFIPERAQIGFGIWTMLPDRDGRSRSLAGQGLTARWRRFRVREGRTFIRALEDRALSSSAGCTCSP
jgi:hypothetical protein